MKPSDFQKMLLAMGLGSVPIDRKTAEHLGGRMLMSMYIVEKKSGEEERLFDPDEICKLVLGYGLDIHNAARLLDAHELCGYVECLADGVVLDPHAEGGLHADFDKARLSDMARDLCRQREAVGETVEAWYAARAMTGGCECILCEAELAFVNAALGQKPLPLPPQAEEAIVPEQKTVVLTTPKKGKRA